MRRNVGALRPAVMWPVAAARTVLASLALTAAVTAGLTVVGVVRAAPAHAQSGQVVPADIYLIDGRGTNSGLDGPAAQAAIGSPDAVLVDDGNIYIADGPGNRVLEVAGSDQTQWGISMTKGDVYVIAGSRSGVPGSSGSGTRAAISRLNDPLGVAMDDSGDLFIADYGNDRVMELTASARPWGDMAHPLADAVYRVAGVGGNRAAGPDGVPAASSDLDGPAAVFIGGNAGGDLYIADSFNNRIQMVPDANQTRWGQRMTAYDAYTVAGSRTGVGGSSGDRGLATGARLEQPQDVTVDNSGDLLIADTANCRIQEVARATGTQWGSMSMIADHMYTVAGRNVASCTGGVNGKTATTSDLNYPSGVSDPSGNLFIADSYSNVVKEVAGSTGMQYGQSMTAGHVYTVAGTGVSGLTGDGGPAAQAELDSPSAVSVDSSGNVYIADSGNNQIREVTAAAPYDITDAAGNGYTLVNDGDDGPAIDSALFNPDGVASDSQGDLFIADAGNDRVQEIAASSHTQFGMQMQAGYVYTVAGSASGGAGATGSGVPATSALLFTPTSVAVDGNGDLYICDSENDRVVEVAATTHTQFGISMTAGDSYTVAGETGSPGDGGDGGPATSAQLNLPSGVAADRAGDLFIADTVNNRIQEVPASSGSQYGIDMTAGDMYTIAGSATGADGISGDGGPGTAALLANPFGLSVDSAGNVYLADTGNNEVRELAASSHTQWGQAMTTGDIYTIAGSSFGVSGNSGDDGPATGALLYAPADVAVDSAGDLYIADGLNNQIREVTAVSGTHWNQSMTAGDIYTVAGVPLGAGGLAVPGMPATGTRLYFPIDVGTDPAGNLYIPDVIPESMLEEPAAASSPFPVYPLVDSAAVRAADARMLPALREPRAQCLTGTAGGASQRILRQLPTRALRIYAELGVLGHCARPAP
jgi:trimeric autotransporter adhesin